jgi:hypothetical protein
MKTAGKATYGVGLRMKIKKLRLKLQELNEFLTIKNPDLFQVAQLVCIKKLLYLAGK